MESLEPKLNQADLENYRLLDKKVNSLTERIARVQIRIDGPRIPKPSTVAASEKKELEDNLVKLENLKKEYVTELGELLRLIARIENAIKGVKNPVLNEILRRHYIDGESLELISVELDYSYRQTKRLRKKALEIFETCPPMSP